MNHAKAKWDAVFKGCLLKGPRQIGGGFWLFSGLWEHQLLKSTSKVGVSTNL